MRSCGKRYAGRYRIRWRSRAGRKFQISSARAASVPAQVRVNSRPMTPEQRQQLFRFIDEACSNSHIRALLREKKDAGGKVRVSGSSEELISNLRAAHESGLISENELIRLLAEGEENGRQHIFLYKTTPQAHSRYGDGPTLKKKLIEANGAAAKHLPRFVLEPTDRTLSDIRLEAETESAVNVLVKWYASRKKETLMDERSVERHGDKFIIREVKIEQVRLVSLARFHPRGLLELRVPTGERESRRTCETELAQMWDEIAPVFDRSHFAPLHLGKALKWLVKNDGKKGAVHHISAAQVADGDAPAEFSPAMEGARLFSHHRHREAIKKYDDFARADVYFTPRKPGEIVEEEIRCQMCPYDSNEFRVGAKKTAEEIDFVVNRLWELSK